MIWFSFQVCSTFSIFLKVSPWKQTFRSKKRKSACGLFTMRRNSNFRAKVWILVNWKSATSAMRNLPKLSALKGTWNFTRWTNPSAVVSAATHSYKNRIFSGIWLCTLISTLTHVSSRDVVENFERKETDKVTKRMFTYGEVTIAALFAASASNSSAHWKFTTARSTQATMRRGNATCAPKVSERKIFLSHIWNDTSNPARTSSQKTWRN